MSSNTVVRLILAGLMLLVLDVVLCVVIFLAQRNRAAPTPAMHVQATPTQALLPRATATLSPRPALRTPGPGATPTAIPARPTASPAPGVITSMDDLDRAIQAGRHGARFSVILSEQQISAEIASYLSATGDVTFRDVTVALQPGVAIITGKARVVDFSVSVKATTTVVVVNGRVRLKVLQLDLLGGLLPGFARDSLMQMIERQTDLPLLADLPVTIDAVDIQTGQVVITGTIN